MVIVVVVAFFVKSTSTSTKWCHIWQISINIQQHHNPAPKDDFSVIECPNPTIRHPLPTCCKVHKPVHFSMQIFVLHTFQIKHICFPLEKIPWMLQMPTLHSLTNSISELWSDITRLPLGIRCNGFVFFIIRIANL